METTLFALLKKYFSNPYYVILIIIHLLNICYVLYSLLFHLKLEIHPDNIDTDDMRGLLRLTLVQFLLWGNAIIWCQPLAALLFFMPLIYLWFLHTSQGKNYISKFEINFILWVIASYFINIVFFLITNQSLKNFQTFKYLFLFGNFNPIG